MNASDIAKLLPTVMQAVLSLLDYIAKVRAAAQQSGEWTPEQEQAYQDLLTKASIDPAWQPDQPS